MSGESGFLVTRRWIFDAGDALFGGCALARELLQSVTANSCHVILFMRENDA